MWRPSVKKATTRLGRSLVLAYSVRINQVIIYRDLAAVIYSVGPSALHYIDEGGACMGHVNVR
jgi:hypothetical protein